MDDTTLMSKYEAKAWEDLVTRANRQSEAGLIASGVAAIGSRASATTAKAIELGKKIPKAEEVAETGKATINKAMAGLHIMTVDFGLNSVSAQTVVKRFQKAGHDVESLDDIRALDLRACDTVGASKKQRYVLAGAVEGSASSLAVTGLTVSSTVSGGVGVGVAAAAVATDVVAVLTGMGRIIASVAANYGYDTRLPDEAVFASGVLAYSTAGNASEKAAAMAALSRLTQNMMRKATWEQLTKHQLVKVVEAVFKALGVKLTHKKLAQAIPVVGVAINGGLNAKMANDTVERAHTAYRLRFLTEKYGLDASAWQPATAVPEDSTGASSLPLIDKVVEAEAVGAPQTEN